MTLEKKIKELLPNREIEAVLAKTEMIQVAMKTARAYLAERYAEKYGVSWEQLVEFLITNYNEEDHPHLQLETTESTVSLSLITDGEWHEPVGGVYFHRNGKLDVWGDFELAAKDYIEWGRYLEGLRDGKE